MSIPFNTMLSDEYERTFDARHEAGATFPVGEDSDGISELEAQLEETLGQPFVFLGFSGETAVYTSGKQVVGVADAHGPVAAVLETAVGRPLAHSPQMPSASRGAPTPPGDVTMNTALYNAKGESHRLPQLVDRLTNNQRALIIESLELSRRWRHGWAQAAEGCVIDDPRPEAFTDEAERQVMAHAAREVRDVFLAVLAWDALTEKDPDKRLRALGFRVYQSPRMSRSVGPDGDTIILQVTTGRGVVEVASSSNLGIDAGWRVCSTPCPRWAQFRRGGDLVPLEPWEALAAGGLP